MIKVFGTDPRSLQNAVPAVKQEIHVNMYEKNFRISAEKKQLRYAFLKQSVTVEEQGGDTDLVPPSNLDKEEFMPFLRNELTKDVEKVIGNSEAVVLLDSSDRVIYDKLTDQYLLEATLVGKNKAQVQQLTPNFLRLMMGVDRYDKDHSVQGFQGDISHLVDDEPDMINIRGVPSKSGEMRIENQGTLRLISFTGQKY